MKKLSLILAAALGLTVLAPASAEAGGYKSRSYVTVDGRGYTLYYEYHLVGYSCEGCPIYRWVIVRSVPPCSVPPCVDHGHGDSHGHGHGKGHGHGHGKGRGHGHGGLTIRIGR